MTSTPIYYRTAACICVALSGFASDVQAQDFGGFGEQDKTGNWDVFVGAGVAIAPEFEGSDEYETTFVPGFQAVWRDRVLITPEGLGAFVIRQDSLRVSAAIGYGGGRKEDDSVYLRGLGNIEDGAVLSLGAQYDLGRRLTATADVRTFLDGSKGTVISVGLQTQVPFGVVRGALLPTGAPYDEVADRQGLAFIGGISLDWADDNYNQSFFGVDAMQSSASGYQQYDAKGGLKSVKVEVGFTQPMGKNWGLTGIAAYSKLLGDAADSPIVQDTDSLSATLAIGYKF